MNRCEHHGHGGQYAINPKTGKRERVARPSPPLPPGYGRGDPDGPGYEPGDPGEIPGGPGYEPGDPGPGPEPVEPQTPAAPAGDKPKRKER